MQKDERLECLLNPKSIAVIGASDNPEKLGYVIVNNIKESGFKGKIYPINPKVESILGLKCYKSIKDVPDEVEIAEIVIPAKAVAGAMRECGEKGVKVVIVISSGFGEVGNKEMEKELVDICKKYNMRLIGPNVFGISNTISSCNATFGTKLPFKGETAFISQSGALGLALTDWTHIERVGLAYMFSIGNMADACQGDLIEVLADDENTKTICQYIEGVHNGRRFFEICKEASKVKPIVALKAGKSSRGEKAAASHTGSLAGASRIYEAAFKQSGVIEANSIRDMFYISLALSKQPPMRGDNLVILTNGGGAGVCATDAAERSGIPIGDISNELQSEFKSWMPEFGSAKNPVDLTGMATFKEYDGALRSALNNSEVDGIIVVVCRTAVADPTSIADSIIKSSKSSDKPITVSFIGGKDCEDAMNFLKENGVPAYPDPAEAVRAMAALREYGRYLERKEGSFKPYSDVDKKKIREIISSTEGKAIVEHRAKEIFSAYGIKTPEEKVAKNAEEAERIASEIGYPVVMKIVSKDILHKSDAKAVKVNVKEGEVKVAFEEIVKNAKAYKSDAEIEGVLVQEMAPSGRETIVGSLYDPQFGPCIMFGLGGIFVEVLKDVVFRLAPISKEEAKEMMKEIKVYPILKGVRGESSVDFDALADAVSRISQLVNDFPEIKEIDANPIFAYEKGYMVADARIILK
ncbi:MAG: acetate--CoA ligase family protein [Candidatus Thermoplasmatota archaeon]|nr:acetate--CoA ligase family protein [Candidatus Thermoplasmatota archaeon]